MLKRKQHAHKLTDLEGDPTMVHMLTTNKHRAQVQHNSILANNYGSLQKYRNLVLYQSTLILVVYIPGISILITVKYSKIDHCNCH